MRVRFKLLYANLEGLKQAPTIISRAFRRTLESLGKRLMTSAEGRMRKDSKESVKSLKAVVRGNELTLRLYVFSSLIQAAVDALGLRPKRAFPNWRKGTRLFAWAARRVRKQDFKEKELGFSFPKRARGRPRSQRKFEVRPVRRIKKVEGAGRPVATRRQRNRDSNIKRFAFLAARSIFKHGIEASHWNTKTLQANESRITLDLQNAAKRAVNTINRTR